ncbi:MAG TPA: ParB N-terminal domain-containing protein [Candidatus Limnocylindrales bacterium]|nr:ParB N-terminal domain-containing protein [Candidatus Limnocylindrales bacterium]
MRQLQKVPLDKIDLKDHFFLITYPLNPEPLIPSVDKVGLLQPVFLRELPSGHYQIVHGFRRVLACRDLHFEALEAWVYRLENLGDLEGFRISLLDNLTLRRLNLIEKATVLYKLLHQFGLEKQKVVQEYMPLLDLEPSLEVLGGYLQLYQLKNEVQSYLVAEEIPLKLALDLLHFSPEDQRQLIYLASSLKLTVNTFKEFMTFIEEIIGREEIPLENLLDDLNIPAILANSVLPVPQKTEKVRKILKQRRYPLLTSLEDQLQEKLKQLRLPREVSIALPPFLEGDRLKVTFQFRNIKELEKILTKLQELMDREELEDILRLLRG